MAEMAQKLRAGETIDIDGVRIRAHKVDALTQIACAHCKVRCDLSDCYATLCSLTDKYNPQTHLIEECHYLEYEKPKDEKDI